MRQNETTEKLDKAISEFMRIRDEYGEEALKSIVQQRCGYSPGSNEKVAVLTIRRALGIPLWLEDDSHPSATMASDTGGNMTHHGGQRMTFPKKSISS